MDTDKLQKSLICMNNAYKRKCSPYFGKVSCLFKNYIIFSPYENEFNGFRTLLMLSPYLQQRCRKCISPSENVVASFQYTCSFS